MASPTCRLGCERDPSRGRATNRRRSLVLTLGFRANAITPQLRSIDMVPQCNESLLRLKVTAVSTLQIADRMGKQTMLSCLLVQFSLLYRTVASLRPAE